MKQRRWIMSFVAPTFLVVATSAASIALDRHWRTRRSSADTAPAAEPSTAAPEVAAPVAAPWIARVTDRVTAVLESLPLVGDRLTWRKDSQELAQFQAWITRVCATDAALHDWVQGLSPEGLQAFAEHLAAFCADMGFELSWVVQQQFATHPALAQLSETVVVQYCRACQQATAAQDELELYKTLRAFEHNPASKKTQAFGQKLFAKVVEAGLTSVSMPEYLLAAPHEQQQTMVQAIREAAQTNPTVFNRLLKEVVEDAAPAVVPTAPPASTSAAPDAVAPGDTSD
jgi:hypothetical protein